LLFCINIKPEEAFKTAQDLISISCNKIETFSITIGGYILDLNAEILLEAILQTPNIILKLLQITILPIIIRKKNTKP
jgi:hypothetical protein